MSLLLAACHFGVLALQSPCIVLDPGHPSENGVGTKGKHLTELQANWTIAKGLEKALVNEGYRVVLTKQNRDEKVTNRRRAEIANKAQAALLLRLHCDAAQGSGIAVFYPSRQGTVGKAKGPNVSVLKKSRAIAKPFHRALIDSLDGALSDRGLKTDLQTAIGKKQGALTGSIFSQVPVLLVELCVLTNPKDEAFLSSKEGQQALVSSLAIAVSRSVPVVGDKRR